jgi:hypothetical protein
MICGKYKATSIRVGLRVGAACGPGEFPEDRAGTVIEQQMTRWGRHWEVRMDDGSRETIHTDVTNEMGIGWYSIEGHE